MSTERKAIVILVLVGILFAIAIAVTLLRKDADEADPPPAEAGKKSDEAKEGPGMGTLSSAIDNIVPGPANFPRELSQGSSIKIEKTKARLVKMRKLRVKVKDGSGTFTLIYAAPPEAEDLDDSLRLQTWKWDGKDPKESAFMIAKEGGIVTLLCHNPTGACGVVVK